MPERTLAEAISDTLGYFDIVGYAPTREELFRWLWQPPAASYEFFTHELEQIVPQHASGFITLPGREDLITKRQEAIVLTEHMLKRARRAARLIGAVPFLKAIFVCNSVGAGMATPTSDIDVLIITAPRHLWIVRLCTHLILRLFRLRTHGTHTAGRICLSFYLDANHLDVGPWRVAPNDIHFAYWICQMTPVYDPEAYYSKFVSANTWLRQFLPNLWHKKREPEDMVTLGTLGKTWKRIWEAMWAGAYGDIIESQAKSLQWQKLPLNIKEAAPKGDYGVVIADGVMKLHLHDTRREIREKWIKCKSEIRMSKSETNSNF